MTVQTTATALHFHSFQGLTSGCSVRTYTGPVLHLTQAHFEDLYSDPRIAATTMFRSIKDGERSCCCAVTQARAQDCLG